MSSSPGATASSLRSRPRAPAAQRDSVGHDVQLRAADAEDALQCVRGGHGDADQRGAAARGPAQRGAAAPYLGVIQPAVHRDHVARARALRSRGAVDRHRELVAVHDVRPELAQDGGERAHRREIQRASQLEGDRLESRRDESCAQPTGSVRESDGEHGVAARAQLLRQLEHHQLGATGAIAFDHERDAERRGAAGAHRRRSHSIVSRKNGRGSFTRKTSL
jgi:hypothetical protein